MISRIFILLLLFSAAFGAIAATARAEEIPAAYRLTGQEVEQIAAVELISAGAGDRVRATIAGGRTKAFYEGAAPVTPELTGLTFDKNVGRWSANLLVHSGETILKAAPVSGRFEEVTQLPVLKRQIRNGEIIAEADVDYLDFPLSRIRGDMVGEAAKLTGLTPRGVISPRRPVRATELAAPAVVKKNDVVSLRYVSSHMEISTSGQALSNAGMGEAVEVRNLNSKTIVRGVVANANTVLINPPPSQALASAMPQLGE